MDFQETLTRGPAQSTVDFKLYVSSNCQEAGSTLQHLLLYTSVALQPQAPGLKKWYAMKWILTDYCISCSDDQ